MNKTEYSLIVPLLNEVESLPLLQQAIHDAMQKNALESFEVIYVDDGSTDASWPCIQALAQQYPNVHGIRLARHRGKAAALAAGSFAAKGRYIITMDADLQNDPNDIPALLEKIRAGHDLVCGWRRNREDSNIRIWMSYVFNLFVFALTRLHLHDSNCGLKAGRAEVFKTIKLYGQLHRYVPLLASAQGFSVTETEINHIPRRFGRSRYGMTRYFYAARDLLVAIAIARCSQAAHRPWLWFAMAVAVGVMGLSFTLSFATGLLASVTGCSLFVWLYSKQREYGNHRFDSSAITII